MAKSIYEVLNDLTTGTSVPQIKDDKGNILRENYGDVSHTIPRHLLPTAEEFENEEQLLEWAEVNNCLHSCLQKGVQKFLIEIRATFKGCKKSDTWNESYGQDNVDAMTWTTTKRPQASLSDEEKALSALGKLSPEKLAEILATLGK